MQNSQDLLVWMISLPLLAIHNSECTVGMALAHFRVLIHEYLNNYPDMVPKEDPLVVLDSKSAMCMAKNGKDTKHSRHLARIMNFVSNGEKWKMHKIDWCEGGLHLADIGTKNVSEPDLTPRMKYIIVRLENWDRILFARGVI